VIRLLNNPFAGDFDLYSGCSEDEHYTFDQSKNLIR